MSKKNTSKNGKCGMGSVILAAPELLAGTKTSVIMNLAGELAGFFSAAGASD